MKRQFWLGLVLLGLLLGGGCAASRSVVFKQVIELNSGIPFDYTKLTKLVIMDSPKNLKERPMLYVVQRQPIDLEIRAADAEGNLYILPPEMRPTWTLMTTVPMGCIEMGPLNIGRSPVYMQDANAGRLVQGQSIRMVLVGNDLKGRVLMEAVLEIRTPAGTLMLHDTAEFEIIESVVTGTDMHRADMFRD